MYKIINHTIEEHHYPVSPKMLAVPLSVFNEGTMLFRMDSRSAWARFAWSLLNYSISMNAQLPGTPQVESRLLKSATALGDFIIPYYGITAGNAFGDKLAAIAKIGAEVVDAVRDGRSLDEFQTVWTTLINELALFMNGLNPAEWPVLLVTELFTNLVNTWTTAILARFHEQWDINEEALDNLNKLVVNGIPNHTHAGFKSLADVFSWGIISQFPLQFEA
jgi:hypothetical protein